MTHAHRFSLRIYYEDTDAQRIVYNANYLKYMERARTELLRELGFTQTELIETHKHFFVLGETHLRYKVSARLDDELVVVTTMTQLGNASVGLRQNILKRLAGEESLLVEGTNTLIYISENRKPVRIPDPIRQALTKYLED
jgi:tol-pal system-associated acyl-CoA thioesterase